MPIEVGVRELDSRLMMAAAHAAMGITTVMGQHDALFGIAKEWREGVYVGKNMFLARFPDPQAERFRALTDKGFTFVHLEEEGAVFGGDEEQWRWMLDIRLDPSILGDDDRLCTWGRFQAEHYVERCPRLAERVHVTGHPRFDVYREPYRTMYDVAAAELRNRYGRFVLVNTNFTFANSRYPMDKLGHSYPPSVRTHLVPRWTSQNRRLTSMVDALLLLAGERPDTTIVVRPHPTENHDLYRFLFRHLDNVVVEEPTGPVAPWLLAASVLVHDGCTTAIEAALAGTPVISFDPLSAQTGQVQTPNDFGDHRTSPEQVVEGVDRALSGQGVSAPPAGTSMRTLLHNLDEAATPLLVDVVRGVAEGSTDRCPAAGRSYRGLRVDLARHRLEAERQARKVVRPLYPARHRRYRAMTTAFPGFDIPGTEQQFQRLSEATGSPGRFHPMGRWLAAVTPGT